MLNGKSTKPTSNRMGDRRMRIYSIMSAGTGLVLGIVFLASSQWFGGVFCLVLGIVLTYLAVRDPLSAEVRELLRASEDETANERDDGEG